MATATTTIWKRIRHHAATTAAWSLVLLAVGVAGLWADVGHVTHAGIRHVFRDSRTVGDVRPLSGSQVLLVEVQWFVPRSEDFNDGFRDEWYCFRDGMRGLPGKKVLYHKQQSWSHFGLTRLRPEDYGISRYTLMFPHWFLLLLLLPWPAKRGWGWLKLRRRKRMGLCLTCGYDLRESPVRCPECGMERKLNDETRSSNDERMPKHE